MLAVLLVVLVATSAFAQHRDPKAPGRLVYLEALLRHGARQPDIIMPGYEDFWASLGYMENAGLTTAGELQLEAVGRLLRRNYVDEERYLPPSFNQSSQTYALSVVSSAQGHYGYVLRSAEAALKSLYPGASIPIFSVPNAIDEYLFRAGNCDSYSMQDEAILQRFDQEWAVEYGAFLTELAEATGFFGRTPTELIGDVYDNIVKLETHSGPMPPFLEEYRDLIGELEFLKYYESIRTLPNDPRGVNGFHISREFLTNIERSLSGENPFLLNMYVTHGNALNVLFEAWGLPFNRVRRGDAFVLEVRENEGELFVNGRYLNRTVPSANSNYMETAKALNCPNYQLEPCPLADFLSYAWDRTGPVNPPPGTRCCLKTPAFFEYGCGDYLNPASAQVPQCYNYRHHCSETACEAGQVLDHITYQCVAAAAKTSND